MTNPGIDVNNRDSLEKIEDLVAAIPAQKPRFEYGQVARDVLRRFIQLADVVCLVANAKKRATHGVHCIRIPQEVQRIPLTEHPVPRNSSEKQKTKNTPFCEPLRINPQTGFYDARDPVGWSQQNTTGTLNRKVHIMYALLPSLNL